VRELVTAHKHESPLFNGQIQGIGPRYCPSLEDKIVRFPERERHLLFLEPEGLDADEIYVNGLSMCLPEEIQVQIVHALPGLREAELIRPGYAVEYDFVQPTELSSTLETHRIAGLYMAGQVNGTSGYEEAAAQGLVAGANAALKVAGRPPLTLARHEAYIGVLVDDLTTRGCLEPYRMFTSRAEHRLLLRVDNADLRLTERARAAGLVSDRRWNRFGGRKSRYINNLEEFGAAGDSEASRREAAILVRRPNVDVLSVASEAGLALALGTGLDRDLDLQTLSTTLRFEGYIRRQEASIEKKKGLEGQPIPVWFSYEGVPGLSREMVQRLGEVRPETVGQASRIPGVTPAAVALIASRVAKASVTRSSLGAAFDVP
jgi:tRNA uridine 5-carboxymethylaminomethyl modification enzyme